MAMDFPKSISDRLIRRSRVPTMKPVFPTQHERDHGVTAARLNTPCVLQSNSIQFSRFARRPTATVDKNTKAFISPENV